MLRSIRRNAVKHAMKKQGMHQICKRHGKRGEGRSYFAEHWRNYL